MNLQTSLDGKVAFLLCLIHITGIDSFQTLSQSSEISLTNTNGQSSNLVFMCAMKAINEDRGYKVNMETGECKAGDSSSPAPGFTYLDKTDMFQHFINEVEATPEHYPVRVQGGFGYNKGVTITLKLRPGWNSQYIHFATGDCCGECPQVVLSFRLHSTGEWTGCRYKDGGWLTDPKVENQDADFPTDVEIKMDFNFQQSSIKVSKNGDTDYLSCPHVLDPAKVVSICTKAYIAVTRLHFYTT